MNSLHKALFAAATAGTLWLTATASPAFAAAPTTYDATGPILEMTDTTLTIMFRGKEKWTFARDTTTKGADTIKVGDRVTVHYTMTAGSIDMAKSTATTPAKKGDKTAAAATTPATTAAASPAGATQVQKPAAESGSAASPAASPGH